MANVSKYHLHYNIFYASLIICLLIHVLLWHFKAFCVISELILSLQCHFPNLSQVHFCSFRFLNSKQNKFNFDFVFF